MQNKGEVTAVRDLSEKVCSTQSLYKGKILDVQKWDVELPDGTMAQREVVLHNGAAAVVAVDDAGRVAMVRQYRTAPACILLEIPAGKKDSKHEDPLACAHRELREETGLSAGRMELLTRMLAAPGYCDEEISIYLATELKMGEAQLDEDEFLSFAWEDFDEMVQAAQRGTIADAKTIVGLLLAHAQLQERQVHWL